MKVVLGIDGGGTATRAALVGLDANLVGWGEGGPSNAARHTPQEMARSIGRAVAAATAGIERVSVVALCAGLAGLRGPRQREAAIVAFELVSEQLGGRLTWEAVPRASLLVTDAEIGLVGGVDGRVGLLQEAGTGSVTFGANKNGDRVQVGGWGFRVGDEGSAYELGVKSLRAVTWAADGRGPATALTRMCLETLGLQAADDLVGWAYGAERTPAEFAAVAAVAATAAQAGDSAALQLLQESATSLVHSTQVAIERLGMRHASFRIATAGGMFKSPIVAGIYREEVARFAPGADIGPSLHAPAYGAALLALESMGAYGFELVQAD